MNLPIFTMSQKCHLTLVLLKLHGLFKITYGTYEGLKSKNNH